MAETELIRGRDFFLDRKLVRLTQAQKGKDYWAPIEDRIDQDGIHSPTGNVTPLHELGFGELRRVDLLYAEWAERVPGSAEFRDGILKEGTHEGVRYNPAKAEWFFKESVKEQLFQIWGNQLAVGYNSLVL